MNTDFYSEIQAEAETLGGAADRLPFCQVLNPKKGFEKRSGTPNYGIFIPAEEAELAGFEPDGGSIWKAHEHTFEGGSTEQGFLAVSPRFVIVYKSGLEVYLPGLDGSRRCAGVAFNPDGTRTPHAERDDAKLVTRYLVGFVDANNQLLHSTPFGLRASGGFGGAFGEEVTNLRRDFAKPLAKVIKAGGVNAATHAYCVGAFTFYGVNPPKGQQPYLAPVARALPLLQGDPGLEEAVEVNRKNGRRVKLTGTELSTLFVTRNNPSRAVIEDWQATYKGFAELPGKKDADAQPSAPAKQEFSGIGTFNVAAVVFNEPSEGLATLTLTLAGGETYDAVIKAEWVDSVEKGTYQVGGWLEGTTVTVDSANAVSDNVPF